MAVRHNCPVCEKSVDAGPGPGLIQCASCRAEFLPPGATQATVFYGAVEELPRRSGLIALSPEFVARYGLRQVVGHGASGTVYAARRMSGGSLVAVKILTEKGDADAQERFVREGTLLNQLNSPNIVQIVEILELDHHPCIVSEYISGGTLKAHAQRLGRLSLTEAISLMADILEGLSACHARGIIHRDLKPSNVLLDRGGRAKISDFGVAKQLDTGDMTLTKPGSILGTPAYMAPEQCRGESVGPAADIYSAGVILYELLSATKPIPGENALQYLIAHQTVKPAPLASLVADMPAGLSDVIDRTLSKDPKDRPATAAALAGMLKEWASRAPVRSTGVVRPKTGQSRRLDATARSQPPPAPRRRRWGLAVGALLVLGLAIGAGLYRRGAVTPLRSPEPVRVLPTPRVTARPAASPTARPSARVSVRPSVRPSVRAPTPSPVPHVRQGVYFQHAPCLTLAAGESREGDGSPTIQFVKVWGELPLRHGSPITSVEFSSDGRSLLSASADGQASVWDLEARSEDRVSPVWPGLASTGGRMAASFGPGGTVIAVAPDGWVSVWSLKRHAAVCTFTTGSHFWTITARGDGLLTSDPTGTVILWDPSKGVPLRRFTGHRRPIRTLTLSPEGTRMITTSDDSTTRMWDLASGQELENQMGANGSFRSVAFSPDGRRVLLGGPTLVRLWDIALNRTLLEWDRFPGVTGLRFERDGRTATVRCADVRHLLDTETGFDVRRYANDPDPRFATTVPGATVQESWDRDTPDALPVLLPRFVPATCVALSANKAWAVSGHADGGIRLWNVDGRRNAGHHGAVLALACAPDGRRVVSRGLDGTVRVWDPETGMELTPGAVVAARTAGAVYSQSVAYLPNGRLMVETAEGWFLPDATNTGAKLGAPERRNPDPHAAHDPAQPVGGGLMIRSELRPGLTRDGSLFVVTRDKDIPVVVTNDRGTKGHGEPRPLIMKVAVFPRIVGGTPQLFEVPLPAGPNMEVSDIIPDGSGFVMLRETQQPFLWDGNHEDDDTLAGIPAELTGSFRFSTNGHYLVTFLNTATMRIIDLRTHRTAGTVSAAILGKPRPRFRQPRDAPPLAITANGEYLVVLSTDGIVALYAAQSGEELARYTLPAGARDLVSTAEADHVAGMGHGVPVAPAALALSPNGQTLWLGTRLGPILQFHLEGIQVSESPDGSH